MPNVSFTESECALIAQLALDAHEEGRSEADALDKLYRKMNAALCRAEVKGVAPMLSRIASQRPSFGWRDVPSLFSDATE